MSFVFNHSEYAFEHFMSNNLKALDKNLAGRGTILSLKYVGKTDPYNISKKC